ncbi:MAG: ABC transporter ATP-binding protein [Candidatus Limnocylindria bacterium]
MATIGTDAVETRGLVKTYAGFRAVDSLDLALEAGLVHALVGPNGAGKTTLFNLLTGLVRPTAGQVLLFGEDATGLRPEGIARRGIARSFQITSLFGRLTVREHITLALQARSGEGYAFWRSGTALRRFDDGTAEELHHVGLEAMADRPAESLPYGHKRALELAIALALRPRLLLLDEPTAGMSGEDIERTVGLVRRARVGRTVILVEHNMGVVASLADVVTVMAQGRLLAQGPYDVVRDDPAVVAAYLGTAHA